jgi:glucose-1-phosphate thymidylyltransferase
MKGIILAGGMGTRLYPLTMGLSKQILPIFDKPMIYYPLSLLISGGIDDILIITTPRDKNAYELLLGDGSSFGININYQIQDHPNGLAHAFIIANKFIGNDAVTMVLGDNIFLGLDFKNFADSFNDGAYIFASFVQDPQRYGVVELDETKNIKTIVEKPNIPPSNFAVTGLYHFDNNVIEIAMSLQPSARGELEITDLNNIYLNNNSLHAFFLDNDVAWFDTGTFSSLSDAGNYVRSIQKRHGKLLGSPHLNAVLAGLITKEKVLKNIQDYNSEYFQMLRENIE